MIAPTNKPPTTEATDATIVSGNGFFGDLYVILTIDKLKE
jgi:hypothetical protein